MRIGTGGTPTVSTQDRWYAEVRAGRAYHRGTTVAPAAAEFGEIQLLNPAASGVNIIVKHTISNLGVAGQIQCREFSTALLTLAGLGANLLFGGAAGLGAVRTAVPLAADGTLVSTYAAATSPATVPIPDWFYELGPGEGILFVAGTVGISIACAYHWIELPV